jgi:hypothetical protein
LVVEKPLRVKLLVVEPREPRLATKCAQVSKVVEFV